MGGLFGVVSKHDCVNTLFYGTDYQSHLGTRRGGLACLDGDRFSRIIHNIENSQFRSKFEDDLPKMSGNMGIGCISDTEDQPLVIWSHLGNYAIVTVGRVNNVERLVSDAFGKRVTHFSEMNNGAINATELIATLINREASFEDGIKSAHQSIDGSCTLLLLTQEGIYAARDRFGRTPLIIGESKDSLCATSETCALPNLDFEIKRALGPGEVALLSPEGMQQRVPPGDTLRICAFLWVYYGYPASSYEGENVEEVRNRSGAVLARRDRQEVDLVAGIPDSGSAHAIGYANESGIPYSRPFVKYTPTWPRSFMPQNQKIRDLVARMKLIPIRELIHGKRLVFCEDSIVRGTQLRETILRIFEYGAKEVHMRPACPPLIYACKYLNFSRSRSELDLVARQAVKELEPEDNFDLQPYTVAGSDQYCAMLERIKNKLNLSTLKYQTLDDMISAIGLPRDNICTYCWNRCG